VRFWSVTCLQYYPLIAHCQYLLTGGRFLPFIRISTIPTPHATCIFMSHRVSLVKPSSLQIRALHWWWVVGLRLRPRNKCAVFTIKHPSFPRPQKARQVRSNVKDVLIVFSTPVGWCITNTHHKANPSPKNTTRGYFVAFVMLCGAKDRTYGQQNLGSSITIMHPPILRIWFTVFWLKTTFPCFVRLPTLPTWPFVIFGCSPNWKCRWKGPDLSQEKTLCGTRQPSWTRIHKKLSRNVSSNGRTAGRSVCISKETILKEIRGSDIQINNCIFADQVYYTFWTHLVMIYILLQISQSFWSGQLDIPVNNRTI